MLAGLIAVNILLEGIILLSGNMRSPFAFSVCTMPTFGMLVVPNKRVRWVAMCTLISRLISAALANTVVETSVFDENLSSTIKFWVSLSIIVTNFFTIERFLVAVSESQQATSNFLSVVSHELRTPLAAIIGLRDLIDEAKSEAERQALLDAITANAECLTSIVDTILLITKLRTSRDESPSSRRGSIDDTMSRELAALESAVACHQVVAKACSVMCDSKLLPESVRLLSECTMAKVAGSYDKFGMHLQQTLLIALTNSCKYTSKGRILVRAEVFHRNNVPSSGDESTDNACTAVLRAAQWATHLLRIDIEDTGVGIAAENRERVFEPFFREEHSGTSGVGLGLPLMRSMLESLMSGCVVVGEPKRVGGGAGGPGTRVTMLLPCTVPHIDSNKSDEVARVDHSTHAEDGRIIALSGELPDRSHSASAESADISSLAPSSVSSSDRSTVGHSVQSALRPLFVLVADDSAILLRIAQRKLEKAGASVLLATDGTSALESAIARYSDLSLIVLDESMPGMSGVEVAMALRDYTRKSGVERAVPVVLYSAHNPKDIGVMKNEDNDELERFYERVGIVAWHQKATKRNENVWENILLFATQDTTKVNKSI